MAMDNLPEADLSEENLKTLKSPPRNYGISHKDMKVFDSFKKTKNTL